MEYIYKLVTSIFMFVTNYINEITHGNQMMAGFLAAGVFGTMMFLVRRIPMNIYHFIKRNTTISFSYDNGQGYDAYLSLMKIMTSGNGSQKYGVKDVTLSSYGRTSPGLTDDERKKMKDNNWWSFFKISIGYGVSWRIYNGRLIKIILERVEKQGTSSTISRLTIQTYGRDVNWFNKLINDINWMDNERDNTKHIYVHTRHGWDNENCTPYLKMNEHSLAMDKDVLSKIVDKVSNFRKSKDFYEALGLPHKLTIALHGAPGTGKTSLVKYLASISNFDIYVLNLNSVDADKFQKALTYISQRGGGILLLEDIDSVKVTLDRDNKEQDTKISFDSSITDLTLSDILNGFDGVNTLTNIITIYTTNHFDKLDPAFKRQGRTDIELEIPLITPSVVEQHFSHHYPELIELMKGHEYPSLKGCEINSIKLTSLTDARKVAEELIKYKQKEVTA